jgi:type I restriction enzyme S subunit
VIGFEWPVPSAFPQVLFRRVFQPVRRPVPENPAIVTAYTDGQVTLRANRAKVGYHEAADLSGFQGVCRGDFVVHGLDILRGSVGVSDSTGAISSVCTVCVPRIDADSRYFAYVMRAQSQSGLPKALAKGVREGGADFRRWDTLAELPLLAPSVAKQRAIADHLDRETARIDALVATKRRMIKLLEERATAILDRTFEELGKRFEFGPISSLCALAVDCVNKTAPTVDEETPFRMIRTSDVRDGVVNLDETQFVDGPTFRIWTRRGRPDDGDVILTREAPVGEVGILRNEGRAVFLGQRLFMYRPDPLRATSAFLAYALRSGAVRERIELLSAGSLHPHLRVGDCLKLPVPMASRDEQEIAMSELARTDVVATKMQGTLRRQINLLGEHRQALISAAVTGALEVPGAA